MLSGRSVLVVESEFIIALGIQNVIEGLGASDVVTAGTPREALATSTRWASSVLAVIELETARPDLMEFARQLSQSGIPVLGISADARLAAGVPELPGTPIILKPFSDADLVCAIKARLAQ